METNPFNREAFYQGYRFVFNEVSWATAALRLGKQMEPSSIRHIFRQAGQYLWLEYDEDLTAQRPLPDVERYDPLLEPMDDLLVKFYDQQDQMLEREILMKRNAEGDSFDEDAFRDEYRERGVDKLLELLKRGPFARPFPAVERACNELLHELQGPDNGKAIKVIDIYLDILRDRAETTRTRTLADYAVRQLVAGNVDYHKDMSIIRAKIGRCWAEIAADDAESLHWRKAFLNKLSIWVQTDGLARSSDCVDAVLRIKETDTDAELVAMADHLLTFMQGENAAPVTEAAFTQAMQCLRSNAGSAPLRGLT